MKELSTFTAAAAACFLTSPTQAFVPRTKHATNRALQRSLSFRLLATDIASLGGIESHIHQACCDTVDDNEGVITSEEGVARGPFVLRSRRSMISCASVTLLSVLAVNVKPALAGIDPSALKSLPVEGDKSGATTRLKQIDAARSGGESDLVEKPWEDLPSGISFREYKEGRGDAVVQPGSKVAVEMTIRCKSFSTANEPGGVKYFSTKEDTDFNELAFTVGGGEILPGLEEGMMGMRRGGLRRIEVPSTMVFAARNAGQLPLPSEKNKDGKRRFENLFKTDATLLFEVLVTRVK